MTQRDWDNYLVAQLSAATLRLIPVHAVAVGIVPGSDEVVVHFRLTEIDEADEEDMADIVGELGILLGDVVGIRVLKELRDGPRLSPHDRTRWVWAAGYR